MDATIAITFRINKQLELKLDKNSIKVNKCFDIQ